MVPLWLLSERNFFFSGYKNELEIVEILSISLDVNFFHVK